MESFLTWWIFHNAQIIQWLIAIIVLLSVLWIGVSFFYKSGSVEQPGAPSDLKEQLNNFESNLKSIIAETKSAASTIASEAVAATGGVVGEGAPTGESAASPLELKQIKDEYEGLKTQLQSKQRELEELKAAAAAAPATVGGGSEPDPSLLVKIKQLETKLAEYEVIEEDIADLSFFKDENKKLKAKLAELGQSIDEPVAEANSPIEAAPVVAAEEASEIPPVSNDPIAEAKIESTADLAAELAAGAESIAQVQEEPSETGKAPDIEGGGDLFSEFSADLNEDIVKQFSDSVSPKSSSEGGEEDVNMDAMLADMEKLETFAASADDSSVLDEELDVDKMANEAGTFDDKKS